MPIPLVVAAAMGGAAAARRLRAARKHPQKTEKLLAQTAGENNAAAAVLASDAVHALTTETQLQQAQSVLEEAYSTERVLRWVSGDRASASEQPAHRAAHRQLVSFAVRRTLHEALHRGHRMVFTDGADGKGSVLGVALILVVTPPPPNQSRLRRSAAQLSKSLVSSTPFLGRPKGAAARRLRYVDTARAALFKRWAESLDTRQRSKPAFVISMLGVATPARGEGVAKALLRAVLRLACNSGAAVYLEATRINFGLFKRHGFRLVACCALQDATKSSGSSDAHNAMLGPPAVAGDCATTADKGGGGATKSAGKAALLQRTTETTAHTRNASTQLKKARSLPPDTLLAMVRPGYRVVRARANLSPAGSQKTARSPQRRSPQSTRSRAPRPPTKVCVPKAVTPEGTSASTHSCTGSDTLNAHMPATTTTSTPLPCTSSSDVGPHAQQKEPCNEAMTKATSTSEKNNTPVMAKSAPYPHVTQRNVDAEKMSDRATSAHAPADSAIVSNSTSSHESAEPLTSNDNNDPCESNKGQTIGEIDECGMLEHGTPCAATAAVDDHFADVMDLAENAAVDDHFADVMDLVGQESNLGPQHEENEPEGQFVAQVSDDEADEAITEAAIEASVVVMDEESGSDDGSFDDSLDDSDAFHSASEGEEHEHGYIGVLRVEDKQRENRDDGAAEDDDGDDFKDAVEQIEMDLRSLESRKLSYCEAPSASDSAPPPIYAVYDADDSVAGAIALDEPLSIEADIDAGREYGIYAQPSSLPERFVLATKGDIEQARSRWQHTLHWRAENGIKAILRDAHSKFELIKEHYPHYYHMTSRNGHIVYYEKPGAINLLAMRKHGVGVQELLRHYIYITEFLWRVLLPSESAKMVTVIDVAGVGIRDFAGDVLTFIRSAAQFTSAHYPERCAHIFIVNVPLWFSTVWKLIAPMLDPVTLAKTHILRGQARIAEELLAEIEPDCLPPEYGGHCEVPLGESVQEKQLATFIRARH